MDPCHNSKSYSVNTKQNNNILFFYTKLDWDLKIFLPHNSFSEKSSGRRDLWIKSGEARNPQGSMFKDKALV